MTTATCITYQFNGKPIESRNKLISSSSITALICEALVYIDLKRAANEEEFAVEVCSACAKYITYRVRVVDGHGNSHKWRFCIDASPAARRKAVEYFKALDIPVLVR